MLTAALAAALIQTAAPPTPDLSWIAGYWRDCSNGREVSDTWSDPRPGQEPAGSPAVQLFNLDSDLGETKNVQAEHPEIVAKLTKQLETLVSNGRSTPGANQANAVPIDLWKKNDAAKGAKGKGKGKKAAAK